MNEKLRKKLDELDINQVELCKFVGLTKPFLSDLIITTRNYLLIAKTCHIFNLA
jgi:hypothetical protein